MTTTESKQLRAEGRPITLTDGTTVSLRFTMLSLAIIEEDYGLEALQDVLKDTDGGEKPKTGQIRLIAQFLALALPPERAMEGDELLSLIPLSETSKAITILSEALDEAFPKGNREARRANPETPKVEA